MSHTPGPWIRYGRHVRDNTDDHALVAECMTQDDSRLIAAAPDLLEACKRAAPWLGKLIADEVHLTSVLPIDAIRTLKMVEDAIAKAEGKS